MVPLEIVDHGEFVPEYSEEEDESQAVEVPVESLGVGGTAVEELVLHPGTLVQRILH